MYEERVLVPHVVFGVGAGLTNSIRGGSLSYACLFCHIIIRVSVYVMIDVCRRRDYTVCL